MEQQEQQEQQEQLEQAAAAVVVAAAAAAKEVTEFLHHIAVLRLGSQRLLLDKLYGPQLILVVWKMHSEILRTALRKEKCTPTLPCALSRNITRCFASCSSPKGASLGVAQPS